MSSPITTREDAQRMVRIITLACHARGIAMATHANYWDACVSLHAFVEVNYLAPYDIMADIQQAAELMGISVSVFPPVHLEDQKKHN